MCLHSGRASTNDTFNVAPLHLVRNAEVRTHPRETLQLSVGLFRQFPSKTSNRNSKRDLGFIGVRVLAPDLSALQRIACFPKRSSPA